MQARLVTAVAAVCLGACHFAPIDSSAADAHLPADVAIDMSTTTLPRSCKEIHEDPSKVSANYEIDPDGPGGDAPLPVFCDMTSDGGGWTVVLLTADNLASTTQAYTSATPRLLADATAVLIAYRDTIDAALPHFATFALPVDWRTSSPLLAANTDVAVNVSIDGAPFTAGTLRYGYQSFANDCADPWITNSTLFGRVCITGTQAPFFSGFSSALADECATSDVAWNTQPCADARRFSIAVR